MRWPRTGVAFVLGACLVGGGGAPVAAQRAGEGEVEAVLQRIQASVKRFYSRALHVMADVRVRVRPMARDFRSTGRRRSLLYEMRVEWAGTNAAAPEPVVMRTLLEANGRPAAPEDEPECADPEPFSEEPLAIFLPAQREDYVFTWSGRDREAGRETGRPRVPAPARRSADHRVGQVLRKHRSAGTHAGKGVGRCGKPATCCAWTSA